jgi:hypothetical protein
MLERLYQWCWMMFIPNKQIPLDPPFRVLCIQKILWYTQRKTDHPLSVIGWNTINFGFEWLVVQFIQLNCICISLDHHYSLKGLNRPNIYDIPLYPSPHKGKKQQLELARKKSWEETHSRGSLLPGMVRSAMGAIIDIQVNTCTSY